MPTAGTTFQVCRGERIVQTRGKSVAVNDKPPTLLQFADDVRLRRSILVSFGLNEIIMEFDSYNFQKILQR